MAEAPKGRSEAVGRAREVAALGPKAQKTNGDRPLSPFGGQELRPAPEAKRLGPHGAHLY